VILSQCYNVKITLFADDVKLYLKVVSYMDLTELQAVLTCLVSCADLRRSSVRARRLRQALACPTAHVSHAAGQTHNPIIIYGSTRK